MSVGLLTLVTLVLFRSPGLGRALRADGQQDSGVSAVACALLSGTWLLLTFPGILIAGLTELALGAVVSEQLARALASTLLGLCFAGAGWFLLRAGAAAAGACWRIGWWDDAVIVGVSVAWHWSTLAGALNG